MKSLSNNSKHVLLIIMFLLTSKITAQFCFDPYMNEPVGSNPQSVLSIDLNNDTIKDLVTCNYSGNGISVLLGTGTGEFEPASNYNTGTNTQSVVGGDFNEDSLVDIAVSSSNSNNIYLFLGDGLGGLSAPTNFIGNGVGIMVSADFNSDGHLDLAVDNGMLSNVSILLGNGAGGFAAPTAFGVASTPAGLTFGYFNADAHIDLATSNVGNMANNVSILLGTGNGSFQIPIHYSVEEFPYSITCEDFNEDGYSDLATSNLHASSVSVLLGNGTGGFLTATHYTSCASPQGITNGDFDMDGNLDLAVTSSSNTYISIMKGDGNGGFALPINFSVDNGPTNIITDDFNTDGKPDLATACYWTNTTSVIINCSSITSSISLNDEDQISIYPNPGNGVFTIKTMNDYPSAIALFNIAGQKIFSNFLNQPEQNIDLTFIGHGMYFIEIYIGSKIVKKKLIIQ